MQNILSVSEVNKRIKEIVSRDTMLSGLWVRGEISNYKYHYSGHMYFTLKDEKSIIKCVMFKTQASLLRFIPENGLKVIARGYVSVFERDGQYQLYTEEMQPDGMGSLHLAFEQLKKKLKQEGLFDLDKKKKLPFLPKSIGVITSSTGAVIRDILNILNRRFPNVCVKILPVPVQGEQASLHIARAVKKLNELKCVDVIILARGGGSLEELWAFNEEIVARSIFDSEIPTISAIGHETDFTIADFVADVRAPTPSAAAELIVPEKSILINRIKNLELRLNSTLMGNVRLAGARLEKLKNSLVFKQPYNKVYQERMRLDVLNKYLNKAFSAAIQTERNCFSVLAGRLNALSPLNILSRGYSVVKSKTSGLIIKSVVGVKNGDEVEVNVSDGIFNCYVNSN